ncbi:MAG: pyridoxal 5'-phosphate synthase glutaminase subunit PdxT [candidate division NC10 bacterium]|nr:pyridoxal 5'-phosphate synthase glutaminase subunit PdxT [candidate division NC10 bacterium]MBI2162881.1 pyridoxal 5'-phosphate synthase glutaminase subunit PdxT [candidate division NC10 bacterium]MBI2458746.1 pyridoxal 5'-phosphate synthase glutaminase subunit PdxT [candidate division NC10 bacterium]MBI2564059.1 pyridoxal 5'-phosphate synthase glutaminase subunit PdxT [candidate division NC10 bacterium]MBI3085825.1 pyridoxal 5'-phosphate synthase glutaminase subunit PdxT [candidate division
MTTIGVLALQGDFREHREAVERSGGTAAEVRLPNDLEGLDGLIIPGGESTTIVRLMRTSGLLEPLRKLVGRGFPVWGTCAGMILLAKHLDATGIPALEAMDIGVRRNAFGRQADSFEVDLRIPVLGDPPFHAIFIRAPVIEAVGPEVEVLARLADGTPVAARQGRLLATAFHPELTPDSRFHRFFLDHVVRRA